MAILKIKHNSQLFADLSAATSGVVAAMENAQVGEFWAGDYGTGAVLAFKGVNGVSVFSDAAALTAEFKASLQNYYTKEEIDTLFNTKLSKYYTKDELDAALDSIVNSAISVVGGDGIIINGDGTEKTISTNVELEIKTVEGKEMIQLLDGTDQTKVLAEVDASKFVVDGMLSSAEIVTVDDETELPEGVELSKGKYIKLSWNTDSGKSDTYVPVADLISEHKVVAGEDVAGEFVVVATNVVESTDENGVKVSTVNVSVDDTALVATLDAKIGKDDAMLSVMVGPETMQATATGNKTHVIIPANNYWEVKFTNFPYTVELYECVDGTPTEGICPVLDYGDGKLTNDNGKVVASQFALDEYQIDTNKEYALVFNYGNGDPADFTITLGIEHEEVINTQQSLSYLNDVLVTKTDKTEVESSLALKADKTEVEAALDTKIGKDDVMLEELLSSWTGNDLLETPYMTNNWSAKVEGMGGGYIPTTIYNENDEVIFVLPSAEELDVANFPALGYTYTHNNGELSILVKLMDAPENYTANIQIDPTSTYKLVFGDNAYYVKLTGDIYTELPTNTKKSFEKLNKSIVRFDSEIKELNENKADKSDIKEILLGERDLGDSVIFHDRDSFEQGSGLDGRVPLEPGYVYFSTISEFDTADGTYDKKLIGIVAGFENKADKSEVESSLALKADKTEVDNKVGKFDTVLSVNDGEYNTDYNVEGALGYLQSEIEAMNVIDCGVY